MKKLIILFFAAVFSTALMAYTHEVTLHAYYWQDYEEQWVNNMNVTVVEYQLHAEGNSGLIDPAWTHAGIRLYTNLNWVHVKIHWVYNGATTFTRTMYAPSGQTIARAKLHASGEGRWENNQKITFNSWVLLRW